MQIEDKLHVEVVWGGNFGRAGWVVGGVSQSLLKVVGGHQMR